MSETLPAERLREVRSLAHRAVTEGVNLKYVDLMRHALYELADETEALQRHHDALEAALLYVEWIYDAELDSNDCPSCGMSERRGHDRSCRTAAALASQATEER